MSTPFGSGSAGEIIGRTAFGIGAVIVWLFMIAMTVRGVRKLLARDKGKPDALSSPRR